MANGNVRVVNRAARCKEEGANAREALAVKARESIRRDRIILTWEWFYFCFLESTLYEDELYDMAHALFSLMMLLRRAAITEKVYLFAAQDIKNSDKEAYS